MFQADTLPGNDSITFEFYKIFWSQFGSLVIKNLEERYKKGERPDSVKQVVIAVKDKEKARALQKNWRPLSLVPVVVIICYQS